MGAPPRMAPPRPKARFVRMLQREAPLLRWGGPDSRYADDLRGKDESALAALGPTRTAWAALRLVDCAYDSHDDAARQFDERECERIGEAPWRGLYFDAAILLGERGDQRLAAKILDDADMAFAGALECGARTGRESAILHRTAIFRAVKCAVSAYDAKGRPAGQWLRDPYALALQARDLIARAADGRPDDEAVEPRPASSRTTAGHVYFVVCPDRVKIGFTSTTVSRRVAGLSTACDDIESVWAKPGDRQHEAALHDLFAQYRRRDDREWFHRVPLLDRYIQSHAERLATPDP